MARRTNTEEGGFFGPFEIHEQLGFGGMATVHRATKRCADGSTQAIALKRILPHLAEDERFVANFQREGQLGLLLDHTNIVKVFETGKVGVEHYIAMEYIDGWNLRQILRCAVENGSQPPTRVVLAILSLLTRALVYAHERTDDFGRDLGLVHRDISPANVLISRSGVLKIIDFGIAHSSSDHPRTHSGTFKGKLGYMSPEALQSRRVDARSDIWSLGVLAHELVTARSLFDQQNEFATIQRVRDLEIPDPRKENSECPLALAAIILRALERDAEKRWQSASEMASALTELITELSIDLDDDAIALWCSQATGEIAPLIEDDHSETLVSIRAPSPSDTSESYKRSHTEALPLPLPPPPLPGPHPTAAPTPVMEAGAVVDTVPPASSAPRITYRSTTVTESAGHIQPVAVPPAGMSYLHSNQALAKRPDSQSRPGSWAVGTTAPPPITTPIPVRVLPAAAPWSQQRPRLEDHRHALTPAPRSRRGFHIMLGLTLCSASAVSIAIISKLTSHPSRPATVVAAPAVQTSGIELQTTPNDAKVYVDGSERVAPLSLEPGTYQLELQAPGYESFREVLAVEAGVDQQFRVVLTPKTGKQVVKTPSVATTPVAASSLDKRKGATLTLPSSQIGSRDRVRALVCVTPAGQVGSANILSDLPGPQRRQLEKQLSVWRYEPLVQEGVKVAACFTSSLPLKGE